MPAHLRFQSKAWAIHHVVSRCIQGYGFLKPTREIRAISKGVLAYALDKYAQVIKLHHYVFLSNHFHLLLSSESSQSLAEFMCFFKGNLARELGRVHDWHGTLWQRRYSSEEVLDEAGLREVFKYLTKNTVKESLVDHPKDWKGLHGYHQLVMGKKVEGPWIDRTAFHRALQSKQDVNIEDYTQSYKIPLYVPEIWGHLTKKDYKFLCKKLSADAILEAIKERKSSAMGMKAVLRQRVKRTRALNGGSRPLCRTKCVIKFKSYQKMYYEFKKRFQSVSGDLRRAIRLGLDTANICFPKGGVPLFGFCDCTN